MKNLLPLLACLLLFSCAPKKKVKNDWAIRNVKGNVKSITYYTYKAVEKERVVEKDSLLNTGVTTFNNMGFLLEDVSKKNGKITFQWICKYDAHNNLLEKETHIDGKLTRRVINKYDEKNNMVEQIIFEKDYDSHTDSLIKSDTHFTYKDSADGKIVESIATRGDKPWYSEISIMDTKGNVIKQKIHYPWDTNKKYNVHMSIYKYDVNNNQLEKDIFDADSTLDFKFVNKYDDIGNNKEIIAYERGDTLVQDIVKTYDDRGNRTRYIIYGKDSIVSADLRDEFKKFDATGNWIEQVSYEKGKPTEITDRTIEYY